MIALDKLNPPPNRSKTPQGTLSTSFQVNTGLPNGKTSSDASATMAIQASLAGDKRACQGLPSMESSSGVLRIQLAAARAKTINVVR